MDSVVQKSIAKLLFLFFFSKMITHFLNPEVSDTTGDAI